MKEVSVDMWGWVQKPVLPRDFSSRQGTHSKKVIKEVFLNTLIIIDRFYVIKLVNKALNKLCVSLNLKSFNNRSLLLKNASNLTEEENK